MQFTSLLFTFQTIVILSTRINVKIVDSIAGYRWSGFKEIANTATFLDKTMLINAIVKRGRMSLLTAPQGFGKTTNLDMVKRFFEIKAGENGEPKNIKMNMNYDLFVENNLHITKNESFFKQYFAKYPVIYIDYSNIHDINCFDKFLLLFGNMQKEIFLEHKYLLSNSNLWDSAWEKNLFIEYMYNNHSRQTQSHDISVGFYFLSELLYKHFNKSVFVFIDELDTFLKSLPKNLTLIKEEIVGLVSGIHTHLLEGNKFVSRALIMEDASIIENIAKLYPSNIRKECVLYDNLLWKYFGITEVELEKILPNILKEKDEKNKLKFVLDEDARKRRKFFERRDLFTYYGLESPIVYKLYSFRSFIQLLQNITTF